MSSKNRTCNPPPPDVPALRPALELVRPQNCAITFASVLLGGWLGAQSFPPTLFLAALSASFIMAGGNALNDVLGVETDRINHPKRPLPSGRFSLRTARIESVFLLALGAALGLALPLSATLTALGATAALVAYNVRLKSVPLVGNLLVSLLCGLAFAFGGFAVEHPLPATIPAVFATLFHFGRELLKDLQDIEGDRLLHGTTAPLYWSHRSIRVLISATYLVLILLTPLPFLQNLYGLPYLILVLLLNGLLLYVIATLWRAETPAALNRLSQLLKAGMLLGLAAIVLGTIRIFS